ncbi:MAG: hypothetical protein ACXWLH_02315 [Candidatus Saccharimonadales bacterium]
MQDVNTNIVVKANTDQDSMQTVQSNIPTTKMTKDNDDTKIHKDVYLGIGFIVFGVLSDIALLKPESGKLHLITIGGIFEGIGVIFVIAVTIRALLKIKTIGAKKTLGVVAVSIVLGLLANIVLESYRYK